jgi:lysophospholipase L1-like esterase
VHIGDSHIQADYATARVRKRLQTVFGSAGRGLVVPFKLAGTNQPVDYKVTSLSGVTTATLLKQPWRTDMTFTGVAVKPTTGRLDLTIKADASFCALKVFYKGESMKASGALVECVENTDGELTIALDNSVNELQLTLHGDAVLAGIELLNGKPGVLYHTIGNNGATFSSYNLIEDFAAGVAQLSPRLIVISLGTNEAFGGISKASFKANVDRLLSSLRQQNPEAQFLLVTPSECQRKKSVKVRKGRRRRTTTTYVANTKVNELRGVILDYAKENGIAVYDWYAVAGGAGSSTKWVANQLLSKDRVHKSVAGYQLQGDLMSKALLQQLKKQ